MAEARIAHVIAPHGPDHGPNQPTPAEGRTIIIVTLTGGDPAQREALAAHVVAATRTVPQSAQPSRLAAVFSRLSQAPTDLPRPPAPASPPPASDLVGQNDAVPGNGTQPSPAATVLPPAEVAEPPSPYEAPFLLAPLRRRP